MDKKTGLVRVSLYMGGLADCINLSAKKML